MQGQSVARTWSRQNQHTADYGIVTMPSSDQHVTLEVLNEPRLCTASGLPNASDAADFVSRLCPLQSVLGDVISEIRPELPPSLAGSSCTWEDTVHNPVLDFRLALNVRGLEQPVAESYTNTFGMVTAYGPMPGRGDPFSLRKDNSQELLELELGETIEVGRRANSDSTQAAHMNVTEFGTCAGAAFRRHSDAPASCSLGLVSTWVPATDPEAIILPLQMIQKRILTGVSGVDSTLSLAYSGQSDHRLRRALTSDWVQKAVLTALRLAYQRAAEKIRNLQNPYHADILEDIPENDDQFQYISTANGHRTSRGKAESVLVIRSRPVTKPSSVVETPSLIKRPSTLPNSGTFRAELHHTLNYLGGERIEKTDMVTLSYIPNPKWHRTGLSITINQAFDTGFGDRIAPTIRTFNVVPWDAEIITLVQNDDLGGVRRLFEKGKASPTDVTASGHSLLSWAIYRGASELFHLLLRGGADLQHCEYCTNTSDLITTLWDGWETCALGGHAFQIGRKILRITDITECMRITDIALSYDCEIGSNTPYNPARPTPLFREYIGHWRPTVSDSDIAEVITFLIRKGFDKDERNHMEQTPLLYAAFFNGNTTAALRALGSNGADVDAVDTLGRGAIHSALMCEIYVCRRQMLKDNEKRDTDLEIHYECKRKSRWQQHDYADLVDEAQRSEPEDMYWHRWISDFEKQGYFVVHHSSCHEDCYCDHEDCDHEGCDHENCDREDCDHEDCDHEDCDHEDCDHEEAVHDYLYHKMLLLLEVGCDPNVRDRDGLTPSDYVRGTPLWPIWEEALGHSGLVYDAQSMQCIKRIQPADEDVYGIEDESDLEIAQFAQVGYQNRPEGPLDDFDPQPEGWPVSSDWTAGDDSLELPDIFNLCSPIPGLQEL
ncbi:hypothetical protein PV11_06550 [Exophiala sideris]|uniref:Uncharacterized protein n=1 Tax=Exophiala sideris TaxID=1016849 RepID=A0A0D1Y7W1_9EURO|nr:hypothetical protein PV11_06550 [Exophiala sideris]